MIKPKVLFLCTANRCRTQMAEAFLCDLAGDRIDILSAGYEEAPGIRPDAVAVMREVGIDISGQHPKKAEQFLKERFSYVITLCNREIEPSYPISPAQSGGSHGRLKIRQRCNAIVNSSPRRAGCAMKFSVTLSSLSKKRIGEETRNGTERSCEREIRAGGFARQFWR